MQMYCNTTTTMEYFGIFIQFEEVCQTIFRLVLSHTMTCHLEHIVILRLYF